MRVEIPPARSMGAASVTSPEKEGKAYFGSAVGEAPNGAPLDLNTWFRWPEPFDILLPTGGGVDLLHHYVEMKQCIAYQQKGDALRALMEAGI